MGYSGEGITLFSTLRDTQLGFDWAFGREENGDLRCAPSKQATIRVWDLIPLAASERLYGSAHGDTCVPIDPAGLANRVWFRHREEITARVPVLKKLTLGQGPLRPAWFAGTIAETHATVLVRYSSLFPSLPTNPIVVAIDSGEMCTVTRIQLDPVCKIDREGVLSADGSEAVVQHAPTIGSPRASRESGTASVQPEAPACAGATGRR
jgi:hypothetical protein